MGEDDLLRRLERPMYYDPDGNPIVDKDSFSAGQIWAEMRQHPELFKIGDDRVNGYRISTVWIGIDHSFGDGDPLIFETMVFPEGLWSEVYCEHYSTRDEALKGHYRIYMLVQQRCIPLDAEP